MNMTCVMAGEGCARQSIIEKVITPRPCADGLGSLHYEYHPGIEILGKLGSSLEEDESGGGLSRSIQKINLGVPGPGRAEGSRKTWTRREF